LQKLKIAIGKFILKVITTQKNVEMDYFGAFFGPP
jgi:hypothetical protein